MARRAKPIEEEEKDDDAEETPSASLPSVIEDKREDGARESELMLKRLKEMTKGKKDQPAFGYFSDEELSRPVTDWISTGNLAIDRQTGGGYPVGRIIEVAAWESVGKSTLLQQSIAQHQRTGGAAAIIESEQSRDPTYARRLGVVPEQLITADPPNDGNWTLEASFMAIERFLDAQEFRQAELAKKGKEVSPLLIVWDSIGGTPTEAELDGDADDKHVGVAARNIRMNFRRLAGRIARSRSCLVFANQFYQTIGPFATLMTYGGGGIRFWTSLRLWLTRKNALRIGSEVVGHEIECKVKKTKVSIPRPPVHVALLYGAGIDNAYPLLRYGMKMGDPRVKDHRWITQNGHWNYLMSPDGTYEPFQRQYIGLAEALSKRPDLYAAMVEQFLADTEYEEERASKDD